MSTDDSIADATPVLDIPDLCEGLIYHLFLVSTVCQFLHSENVFHLDMVQTENFIERTFPRGCACQVEIDQSITVRVKVSLPLGAAIIEFCGGRRSMKAIFNRHAADQFWELEI
jgi:hypothetical protein